MANNKVSKKMASLAEKVLNQKSATKAAKKLAESILAQASDKKKKK